MSQLVHRPTPMARPDPRPGLVDRARRLDPWVWAWLALIVITVAVVIGHDVGVFAPDTKPELYLNPDRLLGRALSAWQPDPHLGQTNYNTGIAPIAAAMAGLQALGIAPWMMQRLGMLAMLLGGAWGAARLTRELGGQGGAGPWLTGLVYAWHPWVVVGAATLPVRLPHALLPWLVLTTHRAVRRGGWGPAAAAALAYAAMAGINGGVVNLMLAPVVPAVAAWTAWTQRTGAWRAVLTVGRTGVLAIGMSLYWLVPSLIASGSSASTVVLATEDPVGVGRLSSPTEVIRGMGMWTQYVVIDGQIENVQQLAFLTSGVVGLATFGTVVAAVIALGHCSRHHRVLAGGGLVAGVVGMIGLNDSGGRGPVGAGLEWLFTHVPVVAAFRTTHKVGTVFVLGVALAIGLGVAPTARRWRSRLRRAGLATLVLVVVVGAGPIVPGQLHPLHMDVPDYWDSASAALDQPDRGRLWLVPGNAATRYLWGYRGVDDLDTALFDDRHVVWRPTIPNGSRGAVNLLTAAGTRLNLGRLEPTALQNLAGLMGVDQLLARTDVDWVRTNGAPSSRVLDQARAAGSVTTAFGPTGRERGLDPALVDPDDPALTVIGLDPATVVQGRALRAPLLVVGDAFGVAALDEELAGRPVLYVDDLTDAQLASAVEAGGEVVVTDTNHRRRWLVNGLADAYTPLLTADTDVIPAEQRARSLDPQDQTVALDLPVTISARAEPYALVHQRAAGRPEFAFDGDLDTIWQYGRKDGGVGGWWQLALPTPARVDEVRVLVDQTNKRITRLQLETSAGTSSHQVVDGVAVFPVDDDVQRLRLTIEETEGFTAAPAGIREVVVTSNDGLLEPVVPGARLPRTLPDRLASGGSDLAGLADAPLRVVLTRLQGTPDDVFDDEEIRLRRRMEIGREATIPAGGVTATVRLADEVAAGTCQTVADIDDVPLRVAPTTDAQGGEPVEAVGCSDDVTLPAEAVELLARPGHVIDRLELREVPDGPPTTVAAPDVTVTSRNRTSMTVATASDDPLVLSSGNARHSGWTARLDGSTDLGAPLLANGYAAGWIVPPGIHEVTIQFAPQGPTRLATWASGATTLLAAGLVLWHRRRRRP